jgi:GntR family transcriptional regulator, transcriptional repressor for pyruvate dehydrogenase complex
MHLARRKADDVADDLLGRIVRGELPVGSVLPREADLAERYGVNRSVVREANKLLEVHRLVRPTRRRGTEVLDPLCSLTPAVLTAMLLDEFGRVDPEMLAELGEIRALLDVQMTTLAAKRHTEQDLVEIEARVAALEQAEPGSHEAFELANDFGISIARASKNRIFVMLTNWHRQIALAIEPVLGKVRAPALHAGGYRLLLDAIRCRDSELVATLVGEFHGWANQRLREAAMEERDARARRTKKH